MNIQIREAAVEDAGTISAIGVASWRAAYRGMIPDAYLDSLSVEQRETKIAGSLAIPDNHFIIAYADGQPAGMANFYPACIYEDTINRDVWELEAIYILPHYWSKGIGQKLIQYIFDYMREKKARSCSLWVLKDNFRAKRFYEYMGFSCTGEEKTASIGGRELIEVRYSICL